MLIYRNEKIVVKIMLCYVSLLFLFDVRLFHDSVAVYLSKELLPCRMGIVREELFCDTLHARFHVLKIIIITVCCLFVIDAICS